MLRRNVIRTGLLTAIAIAPFIHLSTAYAASAADQVQFQVGKKTFAVNAGVHTLPAAPYMKDSTAMIPLRAAAEGLSVKVSWNQAAQTVTLTDKTFGKLIVKLNENNAVTGKGDKLKLPERVVSNNGILFIPARSFSQLMGLTVHWHGADRSIVLSHGNVQVDKLNLSYGFDQDDEDWNGGFADLPVDYNPEIYGLEYKRELIPLPNNTTNYGLKLKGMNRSDDLFMFLTKKVEGLEPDTIYHAKLRVGMYTDQAGGMIGVGGSPGEAVSIKAGVLGAEPKAVRKDDGGGIYYRMNMDKGNQSVEGKDAKILGNITKPDSDKEGYQLVTFDYSTDVTTNSKGECFILIGSDSGYEGLTALYYDDIQLSLTK